jgi:hypothetical protein
MSESTDVVDLVEENFSYKLKINYIFFVSYDIMSKENKLFFIIYIS